MKRRINRFALLSLVPLAALAAMYLVAWLTLPKGDAPIGLGLVAVLLLSAYYYAAIRALRETRDGHQAGGGAVQATLVVVTLLLVWLLVTPFVSL